VGNPHPFGRWPRGAVTKTALTLKDKGQGQRCMVGKGEVHPKSTFILVPPSPGSAETFCADRITRKGESPSGGQEAEWKQGERGLRPRA